MSKPKELVVVVDEEARENLKALAFRYFYSAKKRKDRAFTLETPLGRKRRVKGTLVREPNFEEHAAEYLYLELTDRCNFACFYCGIRDDIDHIKLTNLIDTTARYITPEFVEKFSEMIKEQPFEGIPRKFFYGGGEPLLNPQEFTRVIEGFNNIKRTVHIVSTNGCSLPLDYNGFVNFVEKISKPYIFITVSKDHKKYYAKLRQSDLKKLARYIPQNVPPENALEEKVRIIGDHCNKLGIGFTANTVERLGSSQITEDLRHYIIGSEIEIISTELNGHRDPCSRGQEMSIRSNGNLYPHCYDIFTQTNKIGVVGLLNK